MKKITFIITLFLFAGTVIFAGTPIGVFDLRYTLNVPFVTQQGRNTAWDDVHTVSTLQGIVNRDEPRLYVYFVKNGDQDIDEYWWNKYSQTGEWLYGRETRQYQSIEELVSAYKSDIRGAVVYDENVASTSNVASAVAGIENLIAIRYDTSPESLYSRLVLSGPKLEVKCWLVNEDGSPKFTGTGTIPGTNRTSSGSVKNDPYHWFIETYMKKGLCNTEYGAYYIDQFWKTKPAATVRNHHTLTNHDFFISKKAFFFDLSPWGDEPATDDPDQPLGTDLNTLKEMLLLAYRQNNGEKMCYIGGFPAWAWKYTLWANGTHDDVPTEWEFSRIISSYNAFKDADAIGYGAMANASFWQHFPLQENYPQEWITREELIQRELLTEDGKVNIGNKNFILFYVGDYDASSWITQRTPDIWDDPARGALPLMWCISPVLQQRAPHVMHNFRRTATPNDYFASADNGAGYLMPGMLQEPREISGLPSGLDAWAKHCKPYYEKWGLSVTGFIVDGTAPGLDKNGLNCYESFSPNGIVPQKVPQVSIHRNMPVLQAGADVNDGDPAEAAKVIVNQVRERQGIAFHWFRNILKNPSWYVHVMEEIKKLDENIILLDAPAFFELLRIYLDEDKNAALFSGGKGTSGEPYLIETVEQFSAIRHAPSKYYKLINNLDFEAYCKENVWQPIGGWGNETGSREKFSGVFDGNGHTISNLAVEARDQDLSLFGVLEGAEIRKLLIENCTITGSGRLGVLSGASYYATLSEIGVSHCQVNNTLSLLGQHAGGIAGTLYHSRISDCYSADSDIYGRDRTGGITGSCDAQSTIRNCYSSASVEGKINTGGIIGYSEGKVQQCISLNAAITGSDDSTGRITGNSN